MTDEIAERFPYKEEVTGSNPVAPTRVFQKSLHINSQKIHNLCKNNIWKKTYSKI